MANGHPITSRSPVYLRSKNTTSDRLARDSRKNKVCKKTERVGSEECFAERRKSEKSPLAANGGDDDEILRFGA